MEVKHEKRYIVHWSFKVASESHRRTHSNNFTMQCDATMFFEGLKNLANGNQTFKAKIIKEEVIDVA